MATRIREPTGYQKFMKAELAKIKTETPDIDHKTAFKMAAQRWQNLKKPLEPELPMAPELPMNPEDEEQLATEFLNDIKKMLEKLNRDNLLRVKAYIDAVEKGV